MIKLLRLLKLGFLLLRVSRCKDVTISMSKQVADCVFSCGAVAIKFSQWYAARYEINSSDNQNLCKILQGSFENCPEHSLSYTEKIFKKSFGKSMYSLLDVNPKPIASGSVGQVYEATKRDTGDSVIIKVKHPKLLKDFNSTKFFIKILSFFFRIKIDLSDFLRDIEGQFNYENEAKNLQLVYELYEGDEMIVIPRLISFSSDVIIMTKEDGISYNDIVDEKIREKASTGLMAFQRQNLSVHGIVHGDLHVGNWKIRQSDDDFKIIVYDFGLLNFVDPVVMQRWMKAYQYEDYNTLVKIVLKNKNESELDEFVLDKIIEHCDEVIKSNHSMHKLLKTIIPLMRKNNLTIDEHFVSVIISFSLTEQIFRNGTVVHDDDEESGRNYLSSAMDIVAFCDAKNTCSSLKTLLSNEIDEMDYIEPKDIGIDLNTFYA